MRIKRILVPTDLSEASMPALKLAEDLARTFKAKLVLLFVVEPFVYTSGDVFSSVDVASVIEAQEARARAHLAEESMRLQKRGIRVSTLVGSGMAASAIVETAKKASADVIIIGTHGRSGFSHVFLGSVAERVVRMAGCPVLTVRPHPTKQTSRRAPSKRRGRRGSASGLRRVPDTTLI